MAERKSVSSTSIRISDEAKRLLELAAKRLGITQSAVMELAVREYAARQGITLPPADPQE